MEISRDKMILFLTHIAITFTVFYICVSDSFSGLGLAVFGMIELIYSLILCRNKKYAIITCGSAFVLCAVSFFRVGNVFTLFNYIAIVLLLSSNIVLASGDVSLLSLLCALVAPFKFISAPFSFIAREETPSKKLIFLKILLAAVIIIPCVAVVLILLSSADPVFFRGIDSYLHKFTIGISFFTVGRIWISVLVSIYIFGAFFAAAVPQEKQKSERKGSPSSQIPTVLTFILLAIYAVFSILQIKYLFFGAKLPAGITYAEYARRGFFELLAVGAVNIAVVLAGNKMSAGKTASVTRYVLCAMTAFLILCSFQRMLLYYRLHGLTELRLFVFICLIFELAGLIITVLFLMRPKFCILRSYLTLALIFWLTVNLINIPALTAKGQIDAYFAGKRSDLNYVFSLSFDASDEIFRLVGEDGEVGENAKNYFLEGSRITEGISWQSQNLSILRYKQLASEIYGN